MPRVTAIDITYNPANVLTHNVVAVKLGSTNEVRGSYSTTPASSWNTASLPAFLNGVDASWSGVAYSPSLNRFVAVSNAGDTNNNAIAASNDDGQTWSGQVCPDAGNWALQDVCWSPDLTLFCAVSSAGPTTTKRILTSPDGHTWTERVLPDASIALRCVCWSHDKSIFCALGDSNYVATSPDGTTWTKQTTAPPTDTNTWQRIVWCGGTIQLFIAVGRGGATDVATRSADGASWTMFDTSTNTWDIAYSPDLGYVAFTRANSPSITYSTNGTSWTTVTPSGSTIIKGICWSHSLSLFVCTGTGSDVVTSANGTTWTNHTGAEAAPTGGNAWTRVAAA